jgi:hypothetical protein
MGPPAPPERTYSAAIFRTERPQRRQRAAGVVREAARDIPVFDATDVLVLGGGPAGTAAAIAAARAGARVALVERHNHLGGLASGGLVIWIDRMTDWDGKLVIRGLAEETLDRLPKDAIHGPHPSDWGARAPELVREWKPRFSAFHGVVTWAPMIDPEWLKHVAMEMVLAEKVDLLLHCWMAAPLMDQGRVAGAILETKQGRVAIRARVTIDTTGDGDLYARAGAAFASDIDDDSIHHTINVAWLWGGVDMARWLDFLKERPAEHAAFMNAGRAALGLFEKPMPTWRNDVCVFMGPRFAGYSAVDIDDLNAVELLSRRKMMELLQYYRSHAPGFADAWIMLTAPQMGVRHSRRLTGADAVRRADWAAGVVHDDEIGVSPSLGPNFASVSVPYASLVPRDLDGLLVAGRHMSCDPQSHSFMREIPQCWMTGQAAGLAAAQAVARGVEPRAVEMPELRAALGRQGVYLHPRDDARRRAATGD